jgi:hypothetical protein
MSTAATQSASILTRPTFTLADRIKIQQEQARTGSYTVIGKLLSVVFEGRRKIAGLSQSQPRYRDAQQAKMFSEGGQQYEGLKPFSEKQTQLWASITLDWLHYSKAPLIALSRDQKDLICPFGLTPLPPIPDPRWTPDHARGACPNSKDGCKGCNPPRIPQKLVGCPVVGDRVTDMIKSRDGRTYGVLHPIVALQVMLLGKGGTFAQIRGGVDPADRTHLALLLDDSNPDQLEGYFVGGRFSFGG